jgi:glycosyltransferase involved in cell wall biosynthesis
MVSIVVPAHNEARVIGRLLRQILSSAGPDELDIVVVANGCTDDTVEVAASFGPPVRVVSVPAASKRDALAEGNRAASGFPRLYVDADVELGSSDVRALGEALRRPGVLGAGPVVVHALAGRPWPIRWYYDVWTRLPEVQCGLFGRGVVGVSEEGYRRIASLPPVLADDLAASLEFSPAERMIVPDAKVTVHPPRTFSDLLRGRARYAMGTTQLEQAQGAPVATARTRPADLAAIVRREPHLAPRAALFLMVAVLSRAKARRVTRKAGYAVWLRDASSRN